MLTVFGVQAHHFACQIEGSHDAICLDEFPIGITCVDSLAHEFACQIEGSHDAICLDQFPIGITF